MKKFLLLLILSVATLVSCSSTGPTGDPEADGKSFVKEIVSAYKANSVDQMKKTINTYYKYYKDQDAEDILDFLDAEREAEKAMEKSGEVDKKEMKEFCEKGENTWEKLGRLRERARKEID